MYYFVPSAAESSSVNSLCFVTQALGYKNINGESIQSMLEILLIGVDIPSTDAWNMVSNTRYFPFFCCSGHPLSNRCFNTRIVRPRYCSVDLTNLHIYLIRLQSPLCTLVGLLSIWGIIHLSIG